MLRRSAAASLVALVLGFAQSAGAQNSDGYTRPEILSRQSQVLGGPGAAARQEGLSPLNPLDAPGAGNVWKPSNRDAGNLSAARWETYARRRQEAAASGVAPRQQALSPLNPLDAPDAGNVWKPSNRDAGNLSAARWEAYARQRQEAAAAGAPVQVPQLPGSAAAAGSEVAQ